MGAARTETILRLAKAQSDAKGWKRDVLKKTIVALCYHAPATKVRKQYLKLTRH